MRLPNPSQKHPEAPKPNKEKKMKNRFWMMVGALLVASLLLAGCGAAATSAPATSAPAATSKPADTLAPAEKVELSIWHSYHTGGSEEQALTQIVADYMKENPNVTVAVQAIPFDQLFNKWKTDAASGGAAADMFTAPNDDLGNWVRGGLVEPLDDLLAGKLGGYSQAGVDGVTVEGKIYAVPGIIKAVALYYNKSTVPTPPATTAELLQMAKDGKKLGFIVGGGAPYFNFGWYSAFGGKLMDASNKCVADTTGVGDAMQYLVDLKAAGADFETDGGKIATAFKQGQLDIIVDGPWMLATTRRNWATTWAFRPCPPGRRAPLSRWPASTAGT